MSDLSQKATELFNQGYSCSESIVRAALELNIIDNKSDIENLTRIASAFSGGMGESGCLCGAVAGAQIVLGCTFGRNNTDTPPKSIKALSGQFIQKFKDKKNATCCRVLTKGFDFHSSERRHHCLSIVSDTAEILENHIKENLPETVNIC
ncbi:MAG: C-GCAxxG-C-C family protein [Candidatus Gastranaerophilales bacterium]|nr:C-GCAxxG-C-C family protein [Candidatus Gastranaerophilales bacterium]